MAKKRGIPSKRPPARELFKLYKDHTLAKLADIYQVHPSTVMRWITEYRRARNQGYQILTIPDRPSIHPDFYIFAVDFDGVLCEDHFPEIGPINTELIDECIQHQYEGHKIILWTNRSDNLEYKGKIRNFLTEAKDICLKHGLTFDAVNQNLDIINHYFNNKNPSPKITADVFIDDRNLYYKY